MDTTITLAQMNWNFIAGGLGLFLFGIKLMGDSLTNFAGTKIRDYIEKYTSHPLMAILVGIILTGAIQSSSATTVIAISLVRAGLMRMEQAIGVTLGANIGTTVTSILIGFDVGYFSYYILLIGVVVVMFAARKKRIYVGEILIGFAMLFIGLNMMGDALEQLQYLAGFNNFVTSMAQYPIIAVLVGAVITGIIQSSSAVVGIIQTLFATKSITLLPALGLVFGANIGTTVTAAIASLGGSLAARRTSLFHFLFNVISSLIFLVLIHPFAQLVLFLSHMWGLNALMTVAVGHFIFNVAGVILFLPFLKPIIKLLNRIIPGKDDLFMEFGKLDLDERLISRFPAAALQKAREGVNQVSDLALQSMIASQNFLSTGNRKYFQQVNQLEDTINSMDTKIITYLLRISKQDLSEDKSVEYSINLQVEKNFERVADLVQNLAEYYDTIYESGERFEPEAMEELMSVYELLVHNYVNAVKIFNTKNYSLYETIKEDENNLNLIEYKLRESHFNRITSHYEQAGVITSLFVDILSTMERIGDNAFNVASLTFNPIKTHKEKEIQ